VTFINKTWSVNYLKMQSNMTR